jgi:hypothetical protein
MNLRQHSVLTAAMTLCCLTCQPALAVGGLADLTIIDRSTGETMAVHYHRGDYWVAGRPGAKYAVSLCNRDGGRLLGVVSVDGVNVLSGKTASTNQSGYVFGNRSCNSITGWRKSDSEVAAFEFAASSDSYAALTGRPNQVGVIGVALFRERLPEPVVSAPVYRPEPSRMDDARAQASNKAKQDAPAAAAPATAGRMMDPSAAESGVAPKQSSDAKERSTAQFLAIPKLGTAHGEREQSYVSHTNFERAQPSPNEIIRIRYDSRESLVAMGVIRVPNRIPVSPNPFPVAEYTPDPPTRQY